MAQSKKNDLINQFQTVLDKKKIKEADINLLTNLIFRTDKIQQKINKICKEMQIDNIINISKKQAETICKLFRGE